jgi:glycosyltransferase involved in cell wall biosynthesis
MPENGLDPQRFTQRRARTAALPLRLVYVGRLVPYKGPDLVLEAAAPFLRRGEVELTVVGDGPLRGPMETMAATLGVAERVRFAGWVQHAEVQHQLAAADLFLSPSVREFGGGAALEAMATGLPPVVVDYGGPGEIVDDAVGWKIAIGDRAALLAGLQRVLTEAVAQPGLVDRKGAAAVAQVWPRFAWDKKAQQMLAVYREVLAESAGLAGLGRGKP